MKKAIIFAIILLLILVGASLIYINSSRTITGKVISSEKYSYTEAKCDDKYCQDYLIECEGNAIIKTTPITGMVPHPLDWKDPRGNETINNDCNISG